MFPIPQAPSTQFPLSTVNVESSIHRRGTIETVLQKEAEAQEVQKEAKTTSGQSETSLQDPLKPVFQNPQLCAKLLQLFLAKTKYFPQFPAELKAQLAHQLQSPSPGEDEVETPSARSMASGFPLQVRVPMYATPSPSELMQLPTTHLVGIIKASTEQLEQRILHPERDAKFWR
jgi:hypothetical protein